MCRSCAASTPSRNAEASERLRHFVQVGRLTHFPRIWTARRSRRLLATVKGKPESFAINLAVLKSLSRAEYSPQSVGHFALASEHYCHFTSRSAAMPI